MHACSVAQLCRTLGYLKKLEKGWKKLQNWSFSVRAVLIVVFTVGCCGCLVAKSCLTLCDPMDCSLPGPSSNANYDSEVGHEISLMGHE